MELKRNAYIAKQLEQSLNVNCPVCSKEMPKGRLREHCQKHFADETRAIIKKFKKPTVCLLCKENGGYYKSEKKEAMLKHVSLTHGKLEEYLKDKELLNRKQSEFNNVVAVKEGVSLHLQNEDIVIKKEPIKSPLRSSQRVNAAASSTDK